MNILIVDMIEGFTRQGVLASPRVAALIPKQVAFLKQVPQDSFIILACDSHSPDDPELRRLPAHCMAGTEECEVCSEIEQVITERGLRYQVVHKQTHSAFFNTNMDEYIRQGDEWVVFGCVTDICITANVMELDYRGKKVILLRDLIDTYEITPDQAWAMGSIAYRHDAEIYNDLFFEYYLPGIWGAKIMSANQVLRMMNSESGISESG